MKSAMRKRLEFLAFFWLGWVSWALEKGLVRGDWSGFEHVGDLVIMVALSVFLSALASEYTRK